MRNPREPLPTDYSDFEIVDYDTEWVPFYDADIGGYDGELPTVTAITAEVETPDGDLIKLNRNDLVKTVGLGAVTEAEQAIEDELLAA